MSRASLALGLDRLPQVRRELGQAAAALGLGQEQSDEIIAAGVRAWSAASLAGAGQAVLGLDRHQGGLRLRLVFPWRGEEPPPGMAQELFCPPARRVVFSSDAGRAAWLAFWRE